MSKKIRSGDTVCIIAGNDKGKLGTVLHKSGDQVLVKDVNVKTKHMKPQGQNKQGQIVKIEKPVHVSNVMLCVDGDKPVKVKFNKAETKDKALVYAKDDKKVVYRKIKSPAASSKKKSKPATKPKK